MASQLPPVIPMLTYEDAAAAIDWLTTAFGFRERLRHTEPDGRVSHAELELGAGVIMLANGGAGYLSPAHHAERCELALAALDTPYIVNGVYVEVDDVDKHFAQASQAGATILSEPADQPYGLRSYRAADLEGQRWYFAQVIAQVPAREWGAVEREEAR